MLTDDEKTVVKILIEHKPTPDAWKDPAQAVDKAMNWASHKTRTFIEALMARRIIWIVPIVKHGTTYDGEFRWEKGDGE
jgi:hypothetical protein